jgi:hypothetical protein
MIGIATLLYDLDGALRIEEMPQSALTETRRRMLRVKTLDGGVAVNDTGYSAGDRDLTVLWKPRRREDFAAVQRLVQTWPRLLVTMREGVFVAAPEYTRITGKVAELRLLVLEQVA